jgi:hypothetical protein
MSYKIRYTDEHGRQRTHSYVGNPSGAIAWTETLSRESGGRRAECIEIADGPYDYSGRQRHILTVGDDG